MGVMRVPGTEGATMGPPADRLYAVDPEGVATIKPSACTGTGLHLCVGLLRDCSPDEATGQVQESFGYCL